MTTSSDQVVVFIAMYRIVKYVFVVEMHVSLSY